jgi:hypothetical protein
MAARDDRPSPAETQAARDVIAERLRQIAEEGWTAEHDDVHVRGELASAGALYALSAAVCEDFIGRGAISEEEADDVLRRCPAPPDWPWPTCWWKPKNRRRDLVRAAALIVAEIDRLDRKTAKERADG